MAFAIGWALQAAICKAIGLDEAQTSQTSRVVIDLPSDSAARVRLSMYLTVDQQDALVRVFEATEFKEAA